MSLRIENLDVLYQDGDHAVQALEGVDLDIRPGECVGLVGESGSGKTTLGLACMGLLPEKARVRGNILLEGALLDPGDEASCNALRWSKLAMVFQNGASHLNPVHRIIDQVAEPLIVKAHMGRREARSRAGLALQEMGLDGDLHGRYPHELSGGQAQRALLAMGVILDPQVLILDEPTSALDVLNKDIVARVIRSFKTRNRAVLLITHDLEFAVRHTDALAVLYLGEIMEMLPAADLFTRPLHPYTLALGRSFPTMDRTRDLGGIRGDAFYRMIHQHGRQNGPHYRHSHIQVPGSSHSDGHAPPTGCLFQNRCTQALERCRHEKVFLQEVGTHQVRCVRGGIADLVRVQGIRKDYGKVRALGPTDLTLKKGEVFSLVGETGSGKTTLAMILAGALDPDGGGRDFEGRDMDQWKRKNFRSLARRIGIVYQSPAESVSHRFTVRDIVAEPLRIHDPALGREEVTAMVRRTLADVHLSTDAAFLARYPHELNMGALQRVALARALILEPTLLVADEPTSSLDPSVQAKVLKLLLELQTERGLTMLFVTHDIGLARKISDRIGVMFKGELVEAGPAARLLSRPEHPYTRVLLEGARGGEGPGGTCSGDRTDPGPGRDPWGGKRELEDKMSTREETRRDKG